MSKGFNYSKWDKLELSDDEDTHPGAKFIEENTLRRIKRESHQIKEKERQDKVDALTKENTDDDAKYRALEKKLKELSTKGDESELEKAQSDLVDLQKAIDKRKAELDKLERERKFNADELCYVAKEKTIVGAACKPDVVKQVSFEDYVALHKADMEKYCKRVMPLDECLEFLTDRPHLVHEHCMGYLLLHALDLGMEDRLKDMKRVVKQKYHIKSMLDFAEARKAPPQSVIKPFFSRLLADERVRQDYDESCEQLYVKLVERAEVKKQEELERLQAEGEVELSREERLGPGGLDPLEVYQELPRELQEAYDSGDSDTLRKYMDSIPLEEARTIMKKMVDSGLWVPAPGQDPGTALRSDGGVEKK